MANTFKNAKCAMVTGGATAYTCPAATTAIVIGCIVANIDGTNAANATVHWTDDSDSDTATNLIKLVSVPPNSSLAVIGGANGKLVLEAGDTLVGTASADSDLSMTVSVLEIA